MDVVSKILLARSDKKRKCFAHDGELLIAASPAKPSKVKLRMSDHFFVGLQTGKPALYGWVSAAPPKTSVEDIIEVTLLSIAKDDIGENREELKKQVVFTLQSIQKYDIGTPVVADFSEKSFMDKALVQCIHKVIIKS